MAGRRVIRAPWSHRRRRHLKLNQLESRRLLDAGPIISEFMASNISGLLDEDWDSSDWIEVYNPTPDDVDLAGWYLTDEAGDLDKWQFPAVSLEPSESLVVFASGKDRTDPAANLHTSFKLSADGEYLALVMPDGSTVADEYAPEFPEQYEDVSYGVVQEVETLIGAGSELSYHVPTEEDASLGASWTAPEFDDAGWICGGPASPLLVTEVGTAAVDFVEIQNVSSVAVDTDGWFVAVNDAEDGQINDVEEDIWNLPELLSAGEVTYQTDLEGENYWGSDIWWSTDGAGWVMILDAEGDVADFVVWGYSAAEIASLDVHVGGCHVTAAGAWSGAGVPAEGTSSSSLQRSGSADHDAAADFAFASPESRGTQNAGLAIPFATEGSDPTTAGIGYSTDPTGFEVTFYKANVTVGNLATAEDVIGDPAKQSYTAEETASVINYFNTGAGGHFGSDAPFPSTVIGTDVNDFVTEAVAAVILPEAGSWTFGVNSDDGFGMELTNGVDTFTCSFPDPRGPGDTLMTIDVSAPGVYDLRLVSYERGGGSEMELFAAQGAHGTFDPSVFFLVGDTESGGLSVDGFGGAIRTDVETDMMGVNASVWIRIPFTVEDPAAIEMLQLRMAYNDGFVAYLNGQEVAARNGPATLDWDSTATAARSPEASSTLEIVAAGGALDALTTGTNVLAIHGLNVSAADENFLILPELLSITTLESQRYFVTPTPGTPNESSLVAFVAEPEFSHEHGFYTDPFSLDIVTETPGATVRYTLDGSEPSETNGLVYGGPITIEQTSVVRAAAFKTDYGSSPVETRTYLFLSDVLLQSSDGSAPEGWPTGSVNGQVFDYGMDPDIVNDPVWGPQLIDALCALPTMSIVTDTDNLFDPTTGIYVNAYNRGIEWERPASLELVYVDGTDGFQIDMGLRIRGGYSRSDANPKHAWRLFFRSDYGDAKLDYPLFGDEGVSEFDKIDLRTAQNYSWSFGGDALNAMIREVFSRDTQAEMGQPYTRSQYYHLYLNGQYWGIYQTQERAEASYAESYLGGDEEDYDTIKCSGSVGGYQTEATDGNMDAWEAMWNLAQSGFATDEAYYRVQGLNPDGTRNPDYPVYLDIDNLVDYMIVILYTGNRDAPISKFLSNQRPNNWYGVRDRTGESGFIFFAHDAEHTLLVNDLNENRNGPWPAGDTLNYSNPQWFHQELMAHPDYRMQFADRVQECFFDGGLLTPEKATERFLARAAEIELAIIAESARWGDAKRSTPLTKTNWENVVNATVANYFPQRTAIVLEQFRNTVLRDSTPAPLYPAVEAPTFSQHGGQVAQGFPLFITAASGTIYYTLDGSDPRLPGGAINPAALIFDDTASVQTLVARGATWKYLDNGSDQGTAWREETFDDGSWGSGPAQLGYGDGDEQTTVSYGPDAGNKYITTYLRNEFDVADVDLFQGLTLRLLRDDGAVVYLNGQEIARSNMPGGDIDYQTRASSTVGGATESTFFEFAVDPGLLHEGTNVLAVEIHQTSGTSSDISFDLELEATFGLDPIVLDQSTVVKSRVLDGEWSALSEAAFYVGAAPTADNLAVTELNYAPYAPTPEELAIDPTFTSSDFEFIELINTSDAPVDLTGVRFIDGVTLDFTGTSASPVPAGGRVVVVANRAAFEARYGTEILLAGQFTGNLNNGGETVELADRFDQVIVSFAYDDSGSWPGRADGKGSSLEIVDPHGSAADPDNWRSSTEYGGSPGVAGLGPVVDVVINEVLTHTDPPQVDSIELVNLTTQPIDIGGWYLSDSSDTYEKFRIPDGTVVPAGGYVVFDENDFNPSGGVDPNDFALDGAHGDDVWLLAADSSGTLLRFVDHVEFGAAANGVSFGRWPEGVGELAPLKRVTLGAENSQPRVHPLVISELMYNPPDPGDGTDPSDLEFIEIYNPSPETVDLAGWQLAGGVDFEFAPGTALDSEAVVVVVSFDPADPANSQLLATFCSLYGIGAEVALVGGYSGSLDNGGETVRLMRPDEPPADEPDFVPMILVDEVDYDDVAPWPAGADGGGQSLVRVAAREWGNDPGSWSCAAPDPGACDLGPLVTLDQDGDGRADPLTDGALVVRYLEGLSGGELIAGVLGPEATRTDPAEVSDYLDDGWINVFDVDANGRAEASTDGMLILRYLFGFTGDALVAGVIDPEGFRTDASEIEAFLDYFNVAGAPAVGDNLQIVTASPAGQTTSPGEAVAVDVFYTSDAVDETLVGLGLRIHFDSTKLELEDLVDVLGTGLVTLQDPQPDTADDDGDPSTDVFATVAWADPIGSQWPGEGALPAKLLTVNFTAAASLDDGSTWVHLSSSSTSPGYALSASSAEISGAPLAELSITDVALAEGDSGATDFVFTVSLSQSSDTEVTVEYATVDGTATAGSDYTAAGGQLTFAPGQTERTVTVAVVGDATIEPDETFTIELSQASGATIADFEGVGTIQNDDGLWQSPSHPLDVNRDYYITVQDALIVANFLHYYGQQPVPEGPGTPPFPVAPPPYYDVSGDDYVTVQDALLVANYLHYNGQGPVPEGSGSPSPPAELPSDDECSGGDPVATQDTASAAITSPAARIDSVVPAERGSRSLSREVQPTPSAARPAAPSALQIASAALFAEEAASTTWASVGRKDVNRGVPAVVPVAAGGVAGYSPAEPTAASAKRVALAASAVDQIMADPLATDDIDSVDWDLVKSGFSSSRRGSAWEVLDELFTKLDGPQELAPAAGNGFEG